jgi:hypothetical protein
MPPPAPIQYAVEVKSVRELNLVGRADLAYWTAHLAGTGLTPLSVDGYAEVTLGATDLTWMGLRFNESILVLTLAEAAAPHPNDAEPKTPYGQASSGQAAAGSYLLHAYNSRRSLAFMERAFFRTPYYPAAIQLSTQSPARLQVVDRAGGGLRAEVGTSVRPTRATDDIWEGAVHLPRQRTAPQGRAGYFYVRLAGPGEAFPFVYGSDTVTFAPSRESPVFKWLQASRFTPREWRCRPDATHSKSRTHAR